MIICCNTKGEKLFNKIYKCCNKYTKSENKNQKSNKNPKRKFQKALDI